MVVHDVRTFQFVKQFVGHDGIFRKRRLGDFRQSSMLGVTDDDRRPVWGSLVCHLQSPAARNQYCGSETIGYEENVAVGARHVEVGRQYPSAGATSPAGDQDPAMRITRFTTLVWCQI